MFDLYLALKGPERVELHSDAHFYIHKHYHTDTHRKSQSSFIKGNQPETSVPMGNLSVSVTAPQHHQNTGQPGPLRLWM